jgi:hypothetical protein
MFLEQEIHYLPFLLYLLQNKIQFQTVLITFVFVHKSCRLMYDNLTQVSGVNSSALCVVNIFFAKMSALVNRKQALNYGLRSLESR